MHRSSWIALLLITASLIGCANKVDKDEREVWNENVWKEEVQANEIRMLPEEQRPTRAGMFSFMQKAADAVGQAIANLYNFITGKTPFNAALAMIDPASPDRRRQGVVYLSKRDYGRQQPYTNYYLEMASTDPDHTVRAMSIRALNRARDKRVTEVCIKALEDPHYLVRLEAAKALANMPDPAAVPALIQHLGGTFRMRLEKENRFEVQEEHPDVRIACADALRNHKTLQSAQALVATLRDRSFGISWQARRSLRLMTGKDYRYDTAAWLEYLSGTANPFG